MIIPIKHYYAGGMPSKEDLQECKEICIKEDCMIELLWYPDVFAGYYRIYIKKDTDIEYAYEHQVPKVYGV